MKRFLFLALVAACSSPQTTRKPATATDTATSTAVATGTATASKATGAGVRPRFDTSGTRLAYVQGDEGSRDIVVFSNAGSGLFANGMGKVFESPGDDIDPTWTPDGRVLFASNRDGDFDLWLLDPKDGAIEQVTNLDGDEVEPTVAPIGFGFYAVRNGMCGSSASGHTLDAYYKALFTRRGADSSQVWFASVTPGERLEPLRKSVQPSAHATHNGRVSPDGQSCSAPMFALDGLSAVYLCDGVVQDATARFDASFDAALAVVKEPPAECQGNIDFDKCVSKLDRRYTTYPPKPVSTLADALREPSVSANQTVLVAEKDGRAVWRSRFDDKAAWTPLELDHSPARNIVWSPTGREVAFDNGTEVRRAPTDFYLQTVRNLDRFPEVLGDGESALLHANRFVVRPADHKEFYVLHDKVRYADRPQFVSADVAMQLYRDEFLRLIENAEKEAQSSIHLITGALMNHFAAAYAKSNKPIDRYYAVVFATGWAPLEAALTMAQLSTEELMEAHYYADSDDGTGKRVADLSRPVAQRLPEELPRVYPKLPKAIRAEVKANLERMLRHEGVEDVQVPGESRPRKVDFSQYKIRGAYAENDLGGYFLSMNWFASMPFPLDASIGKLTFALQSLRIGKDKETVLAAWNRVNGMVGSFMGRPVDATVQHVVDELKGKKKFNAQKLRKRLLALRGPVPIRDANNKDRSIAVTLFPKRVGLDVTFFRALTHPKVEGRGMPTSLDVFATLGNERAIVHASADAGAMAASYQKALAEITGRTPNPATDDAYWSTDIYHSWLATLAAFAAPYDVDEKLALDFARKDAWKDRQLYSALAGYAQLKHSAVLYAMQDIGVECGDDTSYYVAVEQPLIPRPRGFVEPNVAFYRGLAKLAERAYSDIGGDPDGPTADRWADEDEPRVNAMNFALDLATIARDELAGKTLTSEQLGFIEFIGGRVEQITIAMSPDQTSFSVGGDERAKRGVALVTDIHTNTQRQEALHVGVGRIFDLWVVVPNDDAGERLTQGGVLSFYEFGNPMSDRLTDQQWGERIDAGKLPPRPAWTKSFIEQR